MTSVSTVHVRALDVGPFHACGSGVTSMVMVEGCSASGRYGGLKWNNFGVYGVWMHKQYSRLVQVKARKRLGSEQLRERQKS